MRQARKKPGILAAGMPRFAGIFRFHGEFFANIQNAEVHRDFFLYHWGFLFISQGILFLFNTLFPEVDPRIRIHIKMKCIRNGDKKKSELPGNLRGFSKPGLWAHTAMLQNFALYG